MVNRAFVASLASDTPKFPLYLVSSGTSILSLGITFLSMYLPLELDYSVAKTAHFGEKQRARAKDMYINYLAFDEDSGDF